MGVRGRGTAGKGGVISRIVDPLERLEACEFEARSEYLVLALDRTFDPERLGLPEQGVGRCWGVIRSGRIEPATTSEAREHAKTSNYDCGGIAASSLKLEPVAVRQDVGGKLCAL